MVEIVVAIVSVVIAAGALVVAIVSAYIASGAKAEAARSADAAESSAEAARRSAQADETMARLAKEEAERYETPWRIDHDKKQRFLLVHDHETETAVDVVLEGDAVHELAPKDKLGPRESMEFMYVPMMGSSREVTVRWRRESDPEDGPLRSWTSHPS